MEKPKTIPTIATILLGAAMIVGCAHPFGAPDSDSTLVIAIAGQSTESRTILPAALKASDFSSYGITLAKAGSTGVSLTRTELSTPIAVAKGTWTLAVKGYDSSGALTSESDAKEISIGEGLNSATVAIHMIRTTGGTGSLSVGYSWPAADADSAEFSLRPWSIAEPNRVATTYAAAISAGALAGTNTTSLSVSSLPSGAYMLVFTPSKLVGGAAIRHNALSNIVQIYDRRLSSAVFAISSEALTKAPDAPTNLRLSVSGADLVFSWTRASTNEATFLVSADGGATWMDCLSPAIDSYSLVATAAVSGATYKVKARNAFGDSSAASFTYDAAGSYHVSYSGNGNTGGSAPIDAGDYLPGMTVTFLGAGTLSKTGFTFGGWNTKDDGTGTAYTAGQAVVMGAANLPLSAKWDPVPPAATHNVTYDGNHNTGGSAPTDSTAYASGQAVTVLGNTGSLARTGYVFSGWNTKADGSGTGYTAAASFNMASANVALYARWIIRAGYHTLSYNGNGNTGGSPPMDPAAYASGESAVVLGNPGLLTKTGLGFVGWNTKDDGTGMPYAAGLGYVMGSADVVLFAAWLANGNAALTIRQGPRAAKLIVTGSTTYRMAYGLGPSLPYNTWTPWEIASGETLWFTFVAEAGKSYAICWDDEGQGSSNYTGNVLVGAYYRDKSARLAGWPADIDSGYSTTTTLSVPSTQVVYLRIIPFDTSAGALGSFAIQVAEAGSANSGESFAWYLDGVVIGGANQYKVDVDPSGLAAGRHRVTAIGRRDGVLFSDTCTFNK